MGSAERRREIIKCLCRRRHETIANLAFEFGVSERTVRRDIEVLSLTEPIYTKTGRYYGGVYVMEGYYVNNMYLPEEEIDLLKKINEAETDSGIYALTVSERGRLNKMIDSYSKPVVKNIKGEERYG